MFISKQNNIKWVRLVIATVVVACLIWAGIAKYDIPVYVFLQNYMQLML